MSNIIDYAKYYGTRTFKEVPFNEIDALVLANIAYTNLSILKDKLPLSLKDACKIYFDEMTYDKIKNKRKVYRYAHNTLSNIKNTIRYKDLIIMDYTRIIDDEKQFGALTLTDNNKIFISFEGTNEYISGWREDFYMAANFPVPSQKLAIEYLTKIAKKTSYFKKIYLMGHSKGGNLAVVAGAFSNILIQNRIVAIYDLDGPGVRKEEFNSLGYKRIIPKIKKYVPEESIVGMILNSKDDYNVIESNSYGILQHHATSWQCFGSYFINAKQSKSSLRFKKEINEFIESNTQEELQAIVAEIFNIFKKTDLKSIEIVSLNKIIEIINYIKNKEIDPKIKSKLLTIFNIILNLYKK